MCLKSFELLPAQISVDEQGEHARENEPYRRGDKQAALRLYHQFMGLVVVADERTSMEIMHEVRDVSNKHNHMRVHPPETRRLPGKLLEGQLVDDAEHHEH